MSKFFTSTQIEDIRRGKWSEELIPEIRDGSFLENASDHPGIPFGADNKDSLFIDNKDEWSVFVRSGRFLRELWHKGCT